MPKYKLVAIITSWAGFADPLWEWSISATSSGIPIMKVPAAIIFSFMSIELVNEAGDRISSVFGSVFGSSGLIDGGFGSGSSFRSEVWIGGESFTIGGEIFATGSTSPEDIMLIKRTNPAITPTTETPITAGRFQFSCRTCQRGFLAG
jgi:hypothetical protein